MPYFRKSSIIRGENDVFLFLTIPLYCFLFKSFNYNWTMKMVLGFANSKKKKLGKGQNQYHYTIQNICLYRDTYVRLNERTYENCDLSFR